MPSLGSTRKYAELASYSRAFLRDARRLIGVYVIKSPVSDNCYVGSSRHVHARVWRHLYCLRRGKHHSEPLLHAFNKYGESMQVFIVWTYGASKYRAYPERLIDKEQEFIDELPSCYNACDSARSPSLDPRVGKRISEAKMGHIHSLETRLKISRSKTGIPIGPCKPETRKKISRANSGKKRTKSMNRALSIRMQAYWSLPANREKHSELMKTVERPPCSDEARLNIGMGLWRMKRREVVRLQRMYDRGWPVIELAKKFNLTYKVALRMAKRSGTYKFAEAA